MNILITGAGGYLGTELINQLLGTKHRVYALSSNKGKISQRFGEKVVCYSNDELLSAKVNLSDIDVVVHCAFARTQEGKDIADSLYFTKEVFKLASYNGCDIINISSRSVYGQNPNIPWTEDSDISPDSLYALAKLSSELLTETISDSKTSYTNIRLAGLLEPTFDDRIVNKFIDNAIKGNNIKIIGGKQQFSFLDIRDAAAGIVSLLEIPSKKWAHIYNLGFTKSYNILEIADTVKIVAKDFNIDTDVVHEHSDATLYAEIDSSKFYAYTNWKPKYDMKKIVRSIFKHKLNTI